MRYLVLVLAAVLWSCAQGDPLPVPTGPWEYLGPPIAPLDQANAQPQELERALSR